MTENSPVPKLDLAPKLNRPLQLWNPLDYLRLLYWVFYFPQALRWYLEIFAQESLSPYEVTIHTLNQALSQKLVIRNFVIQSLILLITLAPIGLLSLKQLGAPINIILGSVVGIFTGTTFGVLFTVAYGIAVGTAFGLSAGITFSLAASGAFGLAQGAAFGAAFGIAVGIAFCVPGGIAFGIPGGIAFGITVGSTFGILASVVTSVMQIIPLHLIKGLLFSLIFSLSLYIAVLRPEDYLIGVLISCKDIDNRFSLRHVTLLPMPKLEKNIKRWITQDLDLALLNINELLKYTYQFPAIISILNRHLSSVSNNQLFFQVSRFAENPFDWTLIFYFSASLNHHLVRKFLKNLQLKGKDNELLSFPRSDTPARAVSAGFWYLYKKKPNKAYLSFAKVSFLLHGDEMCQLSLNLSLCQTATSFEDIEKLKLNNYEADTYFRPTTWHTINSFRRIIKDIQLFRHSIGKQTRALASNRAIGELTRIIQTQDQIPEAERHLIVDIAQAWKNIIEPLTLEIGTIFIVKPVQNPYIIGNPVSGKLFVGREDILRQLEELWITNTSRQSIVLYGHRRMGKTSILRNATSNIGFASQVIYINLQRLGEVENGVGEVLIGISDEIASAIKIDPPSDDDLLKLPQRNFERYLKKVLAEMPNDKLIIALDEFEILEDLIEKGQLSKEFLGYLRGLVQMSPKLAFAFAGLHTLEEMTADYFQPFFASVIPIRVSFLNRAATLQLLANPAEDFPLDYEPAAGDRIYDLTFGQPYLVQLIGFQLVRRYNDYVFEQGRERSNLLTTEDVEAIITEDFFRKGRYYFDGVWRQAIQDIPGQQHIMKTLAIYPKGLTTTELLELLSFEIDILESALKTLRKHDVIHDIAEVGTESKWQITVELLQIWLESYAPPINEI